MLEMVCSRCVQLVLNYPEISQWGTIAWTILHAMAERSGNISAPENQRFAKQQWVSLFEELPKVIPCPECQEHAATWLKAHPVTGLKLLPDSQVYAWIVVWLYEFHEAVNQRLGKPSFPIENLREKYGNVLVRPYINDFQIHIENAVKITGNGMLAWKKWHGCLSMLMSYYGM